MRTNNYRCGPLVICLWLLLGCAPAPLSSVGVAGPVPGLTPGDATYMIDGQALTLRDDQAAAAPVAGAAGKTLARIFGEPVHGDLDGDGVADAALLLVVTSGGSGTFYYLAAAFNRAGAFVGSEAILLGDRIAPQQLSIRHGLVVANYAERLAGQAMTVPPSQGMTKYLVRSGGGLEEILLAEGEGVFAGDVVIGHEVRRFTPCGDEQESWLIGTSPALPAIKAAYQLAKGDPSAYDPMLMVLTGRRVAPPTDGFGADYAAGFSAARLVLSRSGSTCAGPAPQSPARFCGE